MKKKYTFPYINTNKMHLQQIIALSGGNQTEGKVNDPGEEVDAEDALIHIREMEIENRDINHTQFLW